MDVHLVAKPKGVHCQRYGRTNHDGANWRMKDVECFNCGKQGHISRVCQAPRRKQSLPKARKNPVHRKKDETKWVEVEEDEEPCTIGGRLDCWGDPDEGSFTTYQG